jgi:hypothetical protein
MWMIFRSVPKIHDITTDTDNPPRFYALLKLRKDALNPVTYGGQEIAEQQHKAYPDLAPLVLDLPPDKAFGAVSQQRRNCPGRSSVQMKGKDSLRQQIRPSGSGSSDDIVNSPKGKGSRIDCVPFPGSERVWGRTKRSAPSENREGPVILHLAFNLKCYYFDAQA